MIKPLKTSEFEKEVLQSEVPVLLDFWAPWCGHCLNLMPTVEQLSEEYDGKVKFFKINIDEEPDLAMQFGVMSIPSLIKIEGGETKAKTLGALPKDAIVARLGL